MLTSEMIGQDGQVRAVQITSFNFFRETERKRAGYHAPVKSKVTATSMLLANSRTTVGSLANRHAPWCVANRTSYVVVQKRYEPRLR